MNIRYPIYEGVYRILTFGEDEPENLTGPITAIEGHSFIRNKGGRADRGRSYLRFLITVCHP